MIAEIIVALALYLIAECLKSLIGQKPSGRVVIPVVQIACVVVSVIAILSAILRGFV